MKNTEAALRGVSTAATFFAVFFLLAAGPPEELLAGAGEWTSGGPDGGAVIALEAHPANPSTVYLATSGRLYKTEDAGMTWAPTGLAAAPNIVLPTSSASVVYAASTLVDGDNFYRSDDGGETWARRSGPTGRFRLISLASDWRDPSTVYAATSDGLFRTRNGGDEWTPLPNPVSTGAPVLGVAVGPDAVSLLYAATFSGVYRSSDSGATWRRTGLQRQVRGLVVDPVWYRSPGGRPAPVFALTPAGLAVTADRGETWKPIAPGPTDVRRLAVDPADSANLYLIASNSRENFLFRSNDGGATVTPVSDENVGSGPRAVTVAGSSAVLTGSERGVSRSEDAGRLWASANRGIREALVESIVVDPADPAVAFAAAGGALFGSRDAGETWNGPAGETPDIRTVVIDPSDPSTLYACGSGGVRKSSDGGRTWKGTALAGAIFELLVDPGDPRKLLAANLSVLRSSDGGEHWTDVLTPEAYAAYDYFPPAFTAVAAAPSDSSTIYAAGTTEANTGFLYRSDDGGDRWSDLKAGYPFYALLVDAEDSRVVLAGSRAFVYRSEDGGETWVPVAIDQESGPVSVWALARDPRRPSSVFAGTSRGLFWSHDRGVTWTRFEPVLEEPLRSLALDPSGRLLYAGTERGVFRLERTLEACRSGPDRLCLLGAKYQVTVAARVPRTSASIAGHAIAQGDRFGYFSFPDVTGDPGLPEVLVKMVDATGAPAPFGGHVWVFHSSLTDLDYRLTVLETQTGRVRIYDATSSGSLTCGEADTSAFARVRLGEDSSKGGAGAGVEASSGTDLRLLGGRFRATVRARDPRTDRIEEGAALARDDGFGFFGLPGFTGDAVFPEIFLKMVDARAQPGGFFWLFHTGLTDLPYTLTVTDVVTGAVRTYVGGAADGTRLCGEADTTAFHD